MTTSAIQRSVVAIIEDARAFAALQQEWDDLYESSPLATPFQSWAWLYSWWESYGEHYELRLILVRNDEGLLIGIIPLMLERKLGFRRLLFVGTGLTDYLDVLTRQGWEAEVAEATIQALEQIGPWHVADLHQLRPTSAVWDILRMWNGPKALVWQDSCLAIDVRPWDELLMSLKRKMRYDVRRALRRAEADGVQSKLAEPKEAEQAARRLMVLHREAWQGRDIEPQHLTRRFESHLRAAARRMTACGLGGVSEFQRDGEVIASHLLIFGRDFVGEYLTGASQEALEQYQVSSLNVRDGIDVALMRGSVYLDLLRGEEPYKLRWASKVVTNRRIVLGRSRIPWAPYAAYSVLRSKAKRYANSEGTPRWIQSALTRSRVLRFRVRRYMSTELSRQWISAAVDRLRER
jgi:CelD/BcsL family acetyltransferase involved in cellulose biosynthesis